MKQLGQAIAGLAPSIFFVYRRNRYQDDMNGGLNDIFHKPSKSAPASLLWPWRRFLADGPAAAAALLMQAKPKALSPAG
jgi:hypothetical protein